MTPVSVLFPFNTEHNRTTFQICYMHILMSAATHPNTTIIIHRRTQFIHKKKKTKIIKKIKNEISHWIKFKFDFLFHPLVCYSNLLGSQRRDVFMTHYLLTTTTTQNNQSLSFIFFPTQKNSLEEETLKRVYMTENETHV